MSFIITVPGADFSASGLPPLREQIRGFDREGLQGLWLFEDGTLNAAVSGPFADSSGLGNDLSLFTSRAAPTRRSYGIEVSNVNGLILLSTINANLTEFSVVAALRSRLPGSEASVYYQWFGSTDNAYPTTASASHTNSPYPTPSFDGTIAAGDYAVFDSGSDVFGGTRELKLLPSDEASNGDRIAIAYRVDGPADLAAQSTLSGLSIDNTNAAISTYFNGAQTGKYVFGWWPNGTARTAAAISAEIYGIALYDRYLSDSETDAALRAMGKIAASRGVSLIGY